MNVDVRPGCLFSSTVQDGRTESCSLTESMTPRRAWKPPRTGNTCSMVSAMVASFQRRGEERRGETEVRMEDRGGEECKCDIVITGPNWP